MARDADIPPTSTTTSPHPTPNPPAAEPPRPQRFGFSSSSTTQPQYTFTQIIDADHFTIQTLAKRIRNLLPTPTPSSIPTSPPTTTTLTTHPSSTLKPTLFDITWRLIRHDLSEDLVMRPAFTHTLGPEGHQMSSHDRQDHAAGRRALLDILSALTELECMLATATTTTAIASVSEAAQQKLLHISDLVSRTFNDLATHMTIESGQFLPHFESIISSETSRRLAREYASTLVLSPDVTVHARVSGSADADAGAGADGGEGEQRIPVFPGGIIEYVNADLGWLRECYEMVLRDAESDGGQYLTEMVQREIERLQVGKWLSLNERKALRESGPSTGGYDMGKL